MSSSERLISCVMATIPERRAFLQQAVKYFLRQTWPNTELILLVEGDEELGIPLASRIRTVSVPRGSALGNKLNLGVGAAHGDLIQKLDDDDFYAPQFLTTMAAALEGKDPCRAVAAVDCFPILLAATGELKWTGRGRFAGGTLCFSRRLWQRQPFREIPKDVDYWFLADHRPLQIRVCDPELYVYVRHGIGHLWTVRQSQDVDAYFRASPDFSRSLNELMESEDVEFYRELGAALDNGKFPSRGA